MPSIGQRLPARRVAGPAGTRARSFSPSSSVPGSCRASRIGARLAVSRTALQSAAPSPPGTATAVLQQSGVIVSASVCCSPDLTDLTIPAKHNEVVQRSRDVLLADVAEGAGLSYTVMLTAAGAADPGGMGAGEAFARHPAPWCGARGGATDRTPPYVAELVCVVGSVFSSQRNTWWPNTWFSLRREPLAASPTQAKQSWLAKVLRLTKFTPCCGATEFGLFWGVTLVVPWIPWAAELWSK